MYFSLHLNGLDLDLAVGRSLLRVVPMNHRIALAELWHNPGGNYAYIENQIYQYVAQKAGAQPSFGWPRIAVKIAVIIGIYGQMLRDRVLEPDMYFDISVLDDDFVTPAAAMYCRMMGIPIKTIVCTCSNDPRLWDFIHRGFVSNSGLSDKDRTGVERLLHSTLGCTEVNRFLLACDNKQSYEIAADNISAINNGWFCSVAGGERSYSVINSVYRTNSYFIDTDTALCYGGLQDYRAKIGESQLTLLLAEKTPLSCVHEITSSTGLETEQIIKQINQT
jgi:threonine synthase